MIEKLTRREIAIIFTALLIAAVLVGIITILVEGQKSPTILWLEGVLVGLISATWIRKEVLDTYWQIRDAGGRRRAGNQELNTRDVLLLIFVIVVSCLIFAGYCYFTYYYVARPIVYY
jgi:hypothetical protein